MTTIHDYELDSYNINFKKNIITMDVSLDNSFKRIIFSDFFCYHFKHEIPFSILSDIEVVPIESFFRENKKLLEQEKGYAWPVMYDSYEELTEKIIEADVQYIWLNSSYGLNGWVLAKSVSVIDI